MAARGMRHTGLTDLGGLPGKFTPPGRIQEPVLDGEGNFPEIIFAKGVFVPGDEFDGGKLIYQ